MLSLEALFCHVDDFCQWFEPQWKQKLLGDGVQQRQRSRNLYLSETMTILIAFHQSPYHNFKRLLFVDKFLLNDSYNYPLVRNYILAIVSHQAEHPFEILDIINDSVILALELPINDLNYH